MRRYKDLQEREIFEALNKLRDAFLAAKNGNEVNEIINWMFSPQEKIMLGRRVLVAEGVEMQMPLLEICSLLRVGKTTVMSVSRRLESHPIGFKLIENRGKRLESEYQKKKYTESGGSKLVHKKKIYAGITRKDITR